MDSRALGNVCQLVLGKIEGIILLLGGLAWRLVCKERTITISVTHGNIPYHPAEVGRAD